MIGAITALAAPSAAAATSTGARARTAANLCPGADSLPGQLDPTQAQATTLCVMNAQRTARGLRGLRAQPTLTRAASAFAKQMADQHFFDHVSPGGSTLLSRVKSTGYLRGAVSWSLAENIAWASDELSTPRAAVQSWMKSPPHRANLLAPQFTEVGIGIAAGGAPANGNPDGHGSTYVTDFGKRALRAEAATTNRR